ncbi:tRNA (cytosine(49)-C(5))-methyltransferase [Sulfuracidifex tepidarius]|uniref:tRNA (cytosine(72)-C(5))-methyltransferase n=1 Tax=Sulfuracidifex tepidarius TaxID=1294262 RepID=A0A510DUP3_9CREN|nr:tRNA (cytosine(49)-C(5))-methyltransferase [Sulfuracidifex tepidarius]
MDYDEFVIEELRKVYGNYVDSFLREITRPNPRLYVRVNTIKADPGEVADRIGFKRDEDFPEALFTPIKGPFKVETYDDVVIVDKKTAESVMVGADVFRPGVKKVKARVGKRVTVISERGDVVGEGEFINSPDLVVKVDNSLYSSVKLSELPELAKGEIYVQGKSSMFVARLLDPRPGETIVDMNAAPGGKLTHVAQLQPKAKVLGFDHTARKVDKMRSLLAKMNAVAQVFEGDSRYLYEDFNLRDVDRVIIDPPCSAMGLRPKLYDKKTRKDILTFSEYQKQFLNSAYKILKKGGTLIYSTCTVTEMENEAVVEDGRFEVEKEVRFHPMQGMTGFFIAKLIKK